MADMNRGNTRRRSRPSRNRPNCPPTVFLPEKDPFLSGKRTTPGWRPKQVLLKEEAIASAQEKLKSRGDKTDFSDLVPVLLVAWLQTPE